MTRLTELTEAADLVELAAMTPTRPTTTPSLPARTGRARGGRSTARAFVVSVLAVAVGCSSPQDPHGSPILTQVFWVAGGTQFLAWSRASAPIVTSVPPLGSEVDFVFDRRLDGDRIEETVNDGGTVTTRPVADPPVTVQWPGMAQPGSDADFALTVQYNSVARFGGVSSYVYAQPALPGFPSGETVTFALDVSKLTSAYGEPATAPGQIAIVTSPFSVSLTAPAAGVPGSFALPLTFSNRLPAAPAAGTSPFVHVSVEGAAVPYKLLTDASQASNWYLAPADCLGVWPANATLDVTVDAGLPDVFGGKLAQAASISFVTGTSSGAADASCAVGPSPDGGAADAATSDAPDAVSPDAPAADAAPDGSAAAEAGDAAPEAEAAGVDAAPDAGAAVDVAVE
jgi:hypothetical protein